LPFGGMVIVALGFFTLGSLGFEFARRRDVGFAYLLGALWLVTGIGLVIYMNFKAGYSMFWDRYPTIEQHEVRERDYFFVVSFQVWGMFAAFGLVGLPRVGSRPVILRGGAAGAALTVVRPFPVNFPAATRRGACAMLARHCAAYVAQWVG